MCIEIITEYRCNHIDKRTEWLDLAVCPLFLGRWCYKGSRESASQQIGYKSVIVLAGTPCRSCYDIHRANRAEASRPRTLGETLELTYQKEVRPRESAFPSSFSTTSSGEIAPLQTSADSPAPHTIWGISPRSSPPLEKYLAREWQTFETQFLEVNRWIIQAEADGLDKTREYGQKYQDSLILRDELRDKMVIMRTAAIEGAGGPDSGKEKKEREKRAPLKSAMKGKGKGRA